MASHWGAFQANLDTELLNIVGALRQRNYQPSAPRRLLTKGVIGDSESSASRRWQTEWCNTPFSLS